MAPRRSDSPEEEEDAMSVSSHHQNESDDTSSDESEAVQERPIPDPDSDEDELERFVLGDTNNFREQLHKADHDETGLVTEEDGHGHEDLDDAQLFYFDAPAAAPKDLEASASTAVAALPVDPKDAPAWEDSDDERLTVSLATATQLRKLRVEMDEDVIDGVEFTRRARQQYLRLNPYPDWAKTADERPAKRRRRSSAASDDSDASVSGASDEDDGFSAMPLDKFLRDANTARRGQSERPRKLRPEVIDIQRSRDIPDRHRDPVTSLSFHPKYPVLMSSSTDSLLYLHRIDATAQPTPHPMLTSVQVKQVPVRHAEFLLPAGDTIFFAGRRRFIHSWNLPTGLIQRTDKLQGHHLEQRTWERFKLSPCGRYLGIISTSRKGGSYVQVLSVTTMQWIAAARLDSRGGIITFQWWSTGNGMTILGKGGQIGEWSMASRRFVAIWHDEGSTGGTAMALGGHDGPALLGGDKWIAIGSNSGVVNIYDRHALILPSADDELNVKERPEPSKTFMQLTVPVTTILFSPDGQLACFASVHKKDALRLVHTGSLSVYRNWPTEQTPLGRVTSVAFSKDMQLAVGNDAGAVRLWEIRA